MRVYVTDRIGADFTHWLNIGRNNDSSNGLPLYDRHSETLINRRKRDDIRLDIFLIDLGIGQIVFIRIIQIRFCKQFFRGVVQPADDDQFAPNSLQCPDSRGKILIPARANMQYGRTFGVKFLCAF